MCIHLIYFISHIFYWFLKLKVELWEIIIRNVSKIELFIVELEFVNIVLPELSGKIKVQQIIGKGLHTILYDYTRIKCWKEAIFCSVAFDAQFKQTSGILSIAQTKIMFSSNSESACHRTLKNSNKFYIFISKSAQLLPGQYIMPAIITRDIPCLLRMTINHKTNNLPDGWPIGLTCIKVSYPCKTCINLSWNFLNISKCT